MHRVLVVLLSFAICASAGAQLRRETLILPASGTLTMTYSQVCAIAMAVGYAEFAGHMCGYPCYDSCDTIYTSAGDGQCDTEVAGGAVSATASAPAELHGAYNAYAQGSIGFYSGGILISSVQYVLPGEWYCTPHVVGFGGGYAGVGPTVYIEPLDVVIGDVIEYPVPIIPGTTPRLISAIPRPGGVGWIIVTPNGVATSTGLSLDLSNPAIPTIRGNTTYEVSGATTLGWGQVVAFTDAQVDVNADGRFTSADATALSAIVGTSGATEAANLVRWDFDRDGAITAADVTTMQSFLSAGLGSGSFGDVDNDSDVDCVDAITASSAWGHAIGDSAYRVELDFNLDGILDAADKAQFDAIVSCTQTAATCGPGWIGGATPPSSSTVVRSAITWDHDGASSSGPLPAALVIAYADGGTSAIARWNGATWTTIASGISGSVDVLSVDSNDNTLLAAGSFSSIGGTSASNIARFDGTSWTALGAGTNGRVRAIGTDPIDGYLAIGGDFTQAGGSTANHLALWDGFAWSQIGGGTNGNVHALAVDPNGALAVGGSFTQANGSSIGNGIALWDGSSWSAMGTSGVGNNAVLCLATSNPSGYLIVGGSFTSVSGVTGASGIAQWDGTAWSALGSGFDGSVQAILPLTSNKLIVGGAFAASGSSSMNRAAKWTGSAWTSLAGGVAGSSSEILSLARLPSQEIVAGGVFSIAGGVSATNLGRWSDSGKPWIAVQPPHGQMLVVSGSASMSVTPASGYDYAAPLSFEWKHATSVVSDGAGGASTGGGTVSGATTSALAISSLASSDRGIYTVKVSNGCGYVLSQNSTLGDCPADHNGSGSLEVQDIFDFLNDWFAGCVGTPLPGGCIADADFNGGGLAVQDIFDFLNAWFAGCS